MVFQWFSNALKTDTLPPQCLVVSCQEDALSPGLEDEPEDPEEDEDGRRYPLVMSNIASENGHRNSGFSHEKW